MADIAAVFGWTPDVMDRMDLVDLIGWHDLAVERAGVRG